MKIGNARIDLIDAFGTGAMVVALAGLVVALAKFVAHGSTIPFLKAIPLVIALGIGGTIGLTALGFVLILLWKQISPKGTPSRAGS